MSKSIKAVRGMHDILPEQVSSWQYLESQIRTLLAAYGYREIRTPILEQTPLFCRSIGNATDVVEKEMYTFDDRNGESLSLRPEGTASCVRSGIEQGFLFNQIQRLWYMGPMFRYERPQKGRYRQFHQLGVEVFGIDEAFIDAEIILLTTRLWQALGLTEFVSLQINTIGTSAERAQYRKHLQEYLQQHYDKLDEDSQRRLTTNPLRILDSKDPSTREVLAKAPVLQNHLNEGSMQHFTKVCRLLDKMGVDYQLTPTLVRGLDYYTHTVFEWVTDKLGAQGTVCGGGRYDGLVEQLGGKPTPAIGFALGIERLLLLLQSLDLIPMAYEQYVDVIVVAAKGDETSAYALQLADNIRIQVPHFKVLLSAGGSLKSQMKRADKSGARWAFIVGEDEVKEQTVSIKSLREQKEQKRLAFSDIAGFCHKQSVNLL